MIRRFHVPLFAFFSLTGLWLACQVSADEPAVANTTIQLVIDYDDGVQKYFTKIAWKQEMTVLDAMQIAQQHPRGIRFKHRGKGATAFLYEIDGLGNEANGRAWLFRVNGKLVDRSLGIKQLKAGDTILWKFEEYK